MSQILEIETNAAILSENKPAAPWIERFHEEAQSRYEALDWPARKDERWRFAKLAQGDVSSFQPAPAPADTTPLIEASAGLEKPAARVVFCNHQQVHAEGLDSCGVRVTSLADADAEIAARALESLRGDLGSEKYLALQQSNQLSAVVVHAPKNAAMEAPLEIVRWVEGNAVSVFPVTLVVAESNASVRILERIRSADSGQQLAIGGVVLEAGDGAQVTYAHSQELTDSSKFVQVINGHTGRDAQIRALVANFGAGWVRQELTAKLDAPGANCEMFGANLACGSQEIDQRTYQQHLAERTRSNLLFKNALFDKARTIFSGLIHVYEDAHYTDAFQTCRNLLLSEDVEANSMPGLEINADQVRCSHGATSSQIDPEELFYLKARGIREDQARRIVTRGFAMEAVQKLKDSEIAGVLEGLIADRLA